MTQDQFIQAHEQQWLILEVLINPKVKAFLLEKKADNMTQKAQKKYNKRKNSLPIVNKEKVLQLKPSLIRRADYPSLYREICQHLSLAQSRRYSPYLIERLTFLIDQAHQVFYRPAHSHGESPIKNLFRFFIHTFPQTVREEAKWLWLSASCFYLPLIAMLIIIQIWPEFVYSILPPDSVSGMEAMYDPDAEHIGRERGSDSDMKMFGHYIFNNTGIGFRTFATGFLFGIGSITTLLFNGLTIGAVAGHLTQIGYGSTFWPFVSGHSAMELTAIVLSGAAGLKLGFSLLLPGRRSRYQALLDSAASSVKIMGGAAVMFFMAAFIEAFWSSSQTMPIMIKYSVGVAMWILVISFFVFVGENQSDEDIALTTEADKHEA